VTKHASLFTNTSVFTVHTITQNDIFKFIHLGKRFQKAQFCQDKNAVSVWMEDQTGVGKKCQNPICHLG